MVTDLPLFTYQLNTRFLDKYTKKMIEALKNINRSVQISEHQ